MSEIDAIKTESLMIARMVKRLRNEEPPTAGSLFQGVLTLADILNETEPPYTPERAFRVGAKFWAARVAPQIGYAEWDEIVWGVSDKVSDFPGNVVSLFERLFEGLVLKDGHIIVP